MIMQSLTDDQVIVDAGCGDMTLDDPCIIRMDIKLTPYVDVVGDLHALPFRPASITFIFALAVFEHLRQPFVAAKEIYDEARRIRVRGEQLCVSISRLSAPLF